MSRYANLTMSIAFQGDGRRGSVTRVPVTISSLGTTGAPAALNTSSITELSYLQLQPGDVNVTLPAAFTGAYQYYYMVISPPTSSTNAKLLKGNTGDTGVSLVPNLPLVWALGPNVQSFYIKSQTSEQVECWIL
jgi:hypothetical protein